MPPSASGRANEDAQSSTNKDLIGNVNTNPTNSWFLLKLFQKHGIHTHKFPTISLEIRITNLECDYQIKKHSLISDDLIIYKRESMIKLLFDS